MSTPEWDELTPAMQDRIELFGIFCMLAGFAIGVVVMALAVAVGVLVG